MREMPNVLCCEGAALYIVCSLPYLCTSTLLDRMPNTAVDFCFPLIVLVPVVVAKTSSISFWRRRETCARAHVHEKIIRVYRSTPAARVQTSSRRARPQCPYNGFIIHSAAQRFILWWLFAQYKNFAALLIHIVYDSVAFVVIIAAIIIVTIEERNARSLWQ